MHMSRRRSEPEADVPPVGQQTGKIESSPPPTNTSPASNANKVETVEDVIEQVYQEYYSF